LDWIKRHIFGFRAEDSFPLSNERRFAGRVVLFFSALCTVQFLFGVDEAGLNVMFYAGLFLACIAVAYFLCVVLLLGFYVTNAKAWRLFIDSLNSAALTMLAFALVFQGIGLVGPMDDPNTARDFVYFSAVTFSTLGFGDFRPMPDARLWAAGLAVLGNLHLAVLVGAVFKAMR
jgi:hypothetical protein